MHLTASFLSLLLANLAAAASYDYVIIGGRTFGIGRLHPRIDAHITHLGAGPGGLTVANRLSASGKKSVLVLEAGLPHFNDPYIDIPGLFGITQGVSVAQVELFPGTNFVSAVNRILPMIGTFPQYDAPRTLVFMLKADN